MTEIKMSLFAHSLIAFIYIRWLSVREGSFQFGFTPVLEIVG